MCLVKVKSGNNAAYTVSVAFNYWLKRCRIVSFNYEILHKQRVLSLLGYCGTTIDKIQLL